MRKRWYILAALVGGLAAFAVGVWPQKPLWRSGPEAGELRGFSPDGQILITVFTPYDNDTSKWLDPVLNRWGTTTGKLLSRATLPCANPKQMKSVKASPDGLIAVVNEDFLQGISLENPVGIDRIYLHDGVTGERRAGPIPGLRAVA